MGIKPVLKFRNNHSKKEGTAMEWAQPLFLFLYSLLILILAAFILLGNILAMIATGIYLAAKVIVLLIFTKKRKRE